MNILTTLDEVKSSSIAVPIRAPLLDHRPPLLGGVDAHPDAHLVRLVDALPLRNQPRYQLGLLLADPLRNQVARLVGSVFQNLMYIISKRLE